MMCFIHRNVNLEVLIIRILASLVLEIVSKVFTNNEMKKIPLNGTVYDISID